MANVADTAKVDSTARMQNAAIPATLSDTEANTEGETQGSDELWESPLLPLFSEEVCTHTFFAARAEEARGSDLD